MISQPNTAEELSSDFKRAAQTSGKIERVALHRFIRVIEYAPEDMTVTVQTGISLADLQKLVGQNHQWLPLDPPLQGATLHDLISRNLSGPRRFGYGTVRDYLLGLQAVTGDGEIIRSGGRVVKNVAGYDVAKLFIGSGITLGVVTEATFMLRPLPEETRWYSFHPKDLAQASAIVDGILKSEVLPVALDLHNLQQHLEMRVSLEGFSEDVSAQSGALKNIAPFTETEIDSETSFFNQSPPLHSFSVLPSKTFETLAQLNNRRFVARAGNGIIYHDGEPIPKPALQPAVKMLSERLKKTFDPHSILPFLPA